MKITLISIFIIVILILYFLFKKYKKLLKEKKNTPTFIPYPKNAKKTEIIASSDIPELSREGYSISVWIWINDVDWKKKELKYIFYRGQYNAPMKKCQPCVILNEENNLSVYFELENDKNLKSTIKNLPLGRWFNIIITAYKRTFNIFIDGVLKNTDVAEETMKQNNKSIHITSNEGFSGLISQLKYFPYPITVYKANYIYSLGPTEGLGLLDKFSKIHKYLVKFMDKITFFDKKNKDKDTKKLDSISDNLSKEQLIAIILEKTTSETSLTLQQTLTSADVDLRNLSKEKLQIIYKDLAILKEQPLEKPTFAQIGLSGQEPIPIKVLTEESVPSQQELDERVEQPVLSQRPEQPLLSQRPIQPRLIQQPKQPRLSQLPAQPTLSQQPEQPTLSKQRQQPKQPGLLQQPAQPTLSQQPEQPTLSQQRQQPTLSQPPERPEPPSVLVAPGLSQQPAQPTLSQRLEKPEPPSVLVSPGLSQQPTQPTLSQRPERSEPPSVSISPELSQQQLAQPRLPETPITPSSLLASTGLSQQQDQQQLSRQTNGGNPITKPETTNRVVPNSFISSRNAVNVTGSTPIPKTPDNVYNMEPGRLPISILNFKTNQISRSNLQSKSHMKNGTIKFIDFPIQIEDPQFDSITLLKGKDFCNSNGSQPWWQVIYGETNDSLYGVKETFIKFLEKNRMFWFIVCFNSKFQFLELTKELFIEIHNEHSSLFGGKVISPQITQKWNSLLLIDNVFANNSDQLLDNLLKVNKIMYPTKNNTDLFILDFDGHGLGDGSLFGGKLVRFQVIKWFSDLIKSRSDRRLDILSQAGNCVEAKPSSLAVNCRFFNHILANSTLEAAPTGVCTTIVPGKVTLLDPNNQDYSMMNTITKGYLPIFIHDKNKFIELYVKLVLGMKLIIKNATAKNPSACNYFQICHYIDGKKMMNLYDNLQEPVKSKFMNWINKGKYLPTDATAAPKDIRQAIGKLPELKNTVLTASYNKPDALSFFIGAYTTDGFIF